MSNLYDQRAHAEVRETDEKPRPATGTRPMMNATEAVVAMEYAIGYAMMRALFRTALQTVPAPMLAGTLRVPVETLVAFMDGGEPGRALWKAARRYARRREPPETEPLEIALNLLVDTFPVAERVRVRKALAGVLVPALEALRAEAPR